MKKLFAILVLTCGGCVSTQQVMAQTYPPIPVTDYINEQGNLFAMTHTPNGHSPFHVQMQSLVIQPPAGEVMAAIGVVATGQEGPGCCRATFSTLFPWLVDVNGAQYPSVWLMTSAPAFNPDGSQVLVPDMRYPTANCSIYPPQGCIQLYNDVALALDGGGNPITFSPIVSVTGTITGWSLNNKPPVDANGVPLYDALPGGTYNLHEVGTSCGGYLCRLPGQSTLLTRTSTSYYVPPPPPPTCGTPTTPSCDD